MEVSSGESYCDAVKMKGLATRAMMYVSGNLRKIEQLGYCHPEAEELLVNTEQLLWQFFRRPSVPSEERFEWVTHGIYFLRGTFMSAEYVPEMGDDYIAQQPLVVALYRDLLMDWNGLYREVIGKKTDAGQFTKFEKKLLRRFETRRQSPPEQREADAIAIATATVTGKLVMVEL